MTPASEHMPLDVAMQFFQSEHNLGVPLQCWKVGCVQCGFEFYATFGLDYIQYYVGPCVCLECNSQTATAVLLRPVDTELKNYPACLTAIKINTPDIPIMEF